MSTFKSKFHRMIFTSSPHFCGWPDCWRAAQKTGIKTEAKYPSGLDRTTTGDDIYGKRESILGEGGLLGRKKKDGGESAIGVNSYLWRATLDTVSFMPLASADPFGGVILTDWYTDPQNPNERVKINAFCHGARA